MKMDKLPTWNEARMAEMYKEKSTPITKMIYNFEQGELGTDEEKEWRKQLLAVLNWAKENGRREMALDWILGIEQKKDEPMSIFLGTGEYSGAPFTHGNAMGINVVHMHEGGVVGKAVPDSEGKLPNDFGDEVLRIYISDPRSAQCLINAIEYVKSELLKVENLWPV